MPPLQESGIQSVPPPAHGGSGGGLVTILSPFPECVPCPAPLSLSCGDQPAGQAMLCSNPQGLCLIQAEIQGFYSYRPYLQPLLKHLGQHLLPQPWTTWPPSLPGVSYNAYHHLTPHILSSPASMSAPQTGGFVSFSAASLGPVCVVPCWVRTAGRDTALEGVQE